MRLAASRASDAAGGSDLRPRWGLFAAMVAGLAGVSVLLVAQRPDAAERAAECRAVADAAVALRVGPVYPIVGGRWSGQTIDCSAALSAAGVAVDRLARFDKEPVPATPIGITFDRPRRLADDRMMIDYDVVCDAQCGRGYRVELVRRNGRWTVVARSGTWIS